MTNFSSESRPREFELIARLFVPLARHSPGAFGLTDDAATITPHPGDEIVVTADMLTEGIHFRSDDPPDLIARKALRTNLSDLAAKSAVPLGYLLSVALPRTLTLSWLETFAKGLGDDQTEFGVSLLGGDTTVTAGPMTIAITALGTLPVGTIIRRNGAKPGDIVFVSGTIGDSGAGLAILAGELSSGTEKDRDALILRYRLPMPRLALGRKLRGIATSSIDISDGLLADIGHTAETSGVRVLIDADRIPLSAALKSVKGPTQKTFTEAAAAGDDYEVAFTAPDAVRDIVDKIAAASGTPVVEIGRIEAGSGVVLLDSAGREIPVSSSGYEHF